MEFQPVNLEMIQQFVDKGKLAPKTNGLITIRDLVASGIISNPKDGVSLLAKVSHCYCMFEWLLLLQFVFSSFYRVKRSSKHLYI